MLRNSIFSPCGKYRYQLIRIWDDSKKVAMVVGYNPSTAGRINQKTGLEEDDTTIRLLINTLQDLGYGGLRMVNLYAYISSKPSALFEVPDAIGENDTHIADAALSSQEIIFAWGNFAGIEYRAKKMIALFPDALVFGKNANGTPWHPRAMTYAGMKRGEAHLTMFKTK